MALSELGIGTFGKVFKCLDLKYKDDVAIKIIRQIPKYVESAEIEREILDDIYVCYLMNANTSHRILLHRVLINVTQIM